MKNKNKFAKIYELKSKLYIKLDGEVIVANYFYDLDCASIIPRSLKIIEKICSLKRINKKSVKKLIGYIKKSNKWADLLDKKDFNFGDEVFDTRYDLRNNGTFCIDINTEAPEGEKVKFCFTNYDFKKPMSPIDYLNWDVEGWDDKNSDETEFTNDNIKFLDKVPLMTQKEFEDFMNDVDFDLNLVIPSKIIFREFS